MTVVIGLLRGVNLGKRRLSMKDLRATVEGLGHADVETYVQSGNVVFTVDGGGLDRVRTRLEAAISRECGLDTAVVLRTGTEMKKVVQANPFPHVDDPTKLVVVFLAAAAGRGLLHGFDPKEYEPDAWKVKGREIYLSLPNGQARSKLVVDLWKRLGKSVATARNWRSVTTLADMAAK